LFWVTYAAPELESTARPFSQPFGAEGLNTPITITATTASALRMIDEAKVFTGRGAPSSLPVAVGTTRFATMRRRAKLNASS